MHSQDKPSVEAAASAIGSQFRPSCGRESVLERRSMRLVSLEFPRFDGATKILDFSVKKLHF